MTGYNLTIIVGNLTKDPELRYTPQGTAVATMTLAINEKTKTGDEYKDSVTFIPVVLWKGKATTAHEYLKKGDPCFVEGRLSVRSYDKDGVKHYVTEVIADKLILMGNKRTDAKPENEPTNDDDIPFK
jgi:single-strand DNA-binding protein